MLKHQKQACDREALLALSCRSRLSNVRVAHTAYARTVTFFKHIVNEVDDDVCSVNGRSDWAMQRV